MDSPRVGRTGAGWTGVVTPPPLDPSGLTRKMRELWALRGQSVDRQFDVTECPFRASELGEFYAAGRRVAFLPEELATQRGRAIFATIFPNMQCHSLLPDNVVTNDEDSFGWFDYDASTDSPRI